jgi:hypothetical protein
LSGLLTGSVGISEADEKPFPSFDPLDVDLYSSYELSPPDVPFSAGFLKKLTVQQCIDTATALPFPRVLPDGSLRVIGWSPVVPTTSCFLLAASSMPSMKDIRQFLGQQPEKYTEGFWSVNIEVLGKTSIMTLIVQS